MKKQKVTATAAMTTPAYTTNTTTTLLQPHITHQTPSIHLNSSHKVEKKTTSSMHVPNDLLSHNPASPTPHNFPSSFASSLGKQIKPKYFEGMNIQSFFVAKADKSQAAQPYRVNKKKQESSNHLQMAAVKATQNNSALNTTALS